MRKIQRIGRRFEARGRTTWRLLALLMVAACPVIACTFPAQSALTPSSSAASPTWRGVFQPVVLRQKGRDEGLQRRTSTPTRTVQPTITPEANGCLRPPDDYTRVIVNGARLNSRTLWMLQRAQTLSRFPNNLTGPAITQGSYNPGGVAASFGTHDGGGAVDLSIIDARTGQVMRDKLPALIHTLRVVGFAAWVREPDELYNGSPIHIHAIAIGDRDLSAAAKDQLTGQYGYFLGYNGLPQTNNIPVADRNGDPVLCGWMQAMGYRDQRTAR